jgi:ElaB/YqjD/DUF883 family membrane-anchored ribosome-binding protein
MTQRDLEGGTGSSTLGEKASAVAHDIKSVGEKLSAEHIGETAQRAVAGAKDVVAHAQEEGAHLLQGARDVASSSYQSAREFAIEEAQIISDRARRAGSASADYARRAGSSTASFVSANAVPLTLIGAGIGWLAWSLRKQSVSRYEADEDSFEQDFDESLEGEYPLRARNQTEGGRLDGLVSSARDVAGQARQSVGALTERVSESASSVASRATESARAIAERATHGAEVVRNRVTETASQLGSQASELSHQAREQVRVAGIRTRDFADESPLLVGAIAVAAGLGVGLLLPATQPENRLLGETRDRLLGDAKGLLGDAPNILEDAREVALETAGQVGQRARETAQEVRREVTDSRLSH